MTISETFDPDTVKYAIFNGITGLSIIGEECEKCGSRHTCQEDSGWQSGPTTTAFCHVCGHIRPGKHGIVWITVFGPEGDMEMNPYGSGMSRRQYRVPGEVYQDLATGLFELRAIPGFEQGHVKYVCSRGKKHGSGYSVTYSRSRAKLVFGRYPAVLKQGVIR